jgi:glycosyltransferase involved in cell wall biosynthesis
MAKTDIFIIIPAFNPGEIITEVVDKTRGYSQNLVLVDDGCDAENKVILFKLEQLPEITLLTHSENQGKGFALHTGIKYALKNNAQRIIMLDSDGQHRPEELPKFLEFADSTDFNLVIGVRTEIDKMPLRSKIGNVSMAKIFAFLYGQKLKDTQSGYRMMSAEFARLFLDNVEAGRYETEMQMLMFAAKSKIHINQIPIETRYFDGNSNSKFRPLVDSLRVLGSFAKYSGVGFASFLLDYSIFIFLSSFLSIYFITAHLCSRVISGAFNFAANRKFVFNNKQPLSNTISKYLIAVALSLGISSTLLYLIVDVFSIKPSLAKIIAEASTFLLNYFILKHFVFKK